MFFVFYYVSFLSLSFRPLIAEVFIYLLFLLQKYNITLLQ